MFPQTTSTDVLEAHSKFLQCDEIATLREHGGPLIRPHLIAARTPVVRMLTKIIDVAVIGPATTTPVVEMRACRGKCRNERRHQPCDGTSDQFNSRGRDDGARPRRVCSRMQRLASHWWRHAIGAARPVDRVETIRRICRCYAKERSRPSLKNPLIFYI